MKVLVLSLPTPKGKLENLVNLILQFGEIDKLIQIFLSPYYRMWGSSAIRVVHRLETRPDTIFNYND